MLDSKPFNFDSSCFLNSSHSDLLAYSLNWESCIAYVDSHTIFPPTQSYLRRMFPSESISTQFLRMLESIPLNTCFWVYAMYALPLSYGFPSSLKYKKQSFYSFDSVNGWTEIGFILRYSRMSRFIASLFTIFLAKNAFSWQLCDAKDIASISA